MTADLVAFLRARLDEVEQAATAAPAGPWGVGTTTRPYAPFGDAVQMVRDGEHLILDGQLYPVEVSDHGTHVHGPGQMVAHTPGRTGAGDQVTAEHIARHDPARVLREVEAKRRIIDLHAGSHECSSWNSAHGEVDNRAWVPAGDNCSTVRLLALPDSDHPDYREEWRL